MKKINLILLFLFALTSLKAQLGLQVEKPGGALAFGVDYSGKVDAYESISSHNSTNDAFWANTPGR